MRQHFQFCTHDYPVYYISSTLQIRTYASSENEKQEIILVLHLPRTPKEEKRKKRIFIRDCTRSTRSNERMNPGIQKKKVIITFMRAHDTIIYSTRCISLYSPRAASIILFPMRLSRTIPCNNNNNTVLFTLVRFDTHLHTRC